MCQANEPLRRSSLRRNKRWHRTIERIGNGATCAFAISSVMGFYTLIPTLLSQSLQVWLAFRSQMSHNNAVHRRTGPRPNSAFTLIELLAVIAVIAILAA